mmetsp:Transcript_59804/g.129640  ORF Transcript_59804/g.129640 Transcript_59804/m.129640 type:complete len:160 (-) Transcript_59804:1590-2069(-)
MQVASRLLTGIIVALLMQPSIVMFDRMFQKSQRVTNGVLSKAMVNAARATRRNLIGQMARVSSDSVSGVGDIVRALDRGDLRGALSAWAEAVQAMRVDEAQKHIIRARQASTWSEQGSGPESRPSCLKHSTRPPSQLLPEETQSLTCADTHKAVDARKR